MAAVLVWLLVRSASLASQAEVSLAERIEEIAAATEANLAGTNLLEPSMAKLRQTSLEVTVKLDTQGEVRLGVVATLAVPSWAQVVTRFFAPVAAPILAIRALPQTTRRMRQEYTFARLSVRLKRASGLKAADRGGVSDPCAERPAPTPPRPEASERLACPARPPCPARAPPDRS
jgi:hypothetical protein